VIQPTPEQLASVKFNADGLVPVIAQDVWRKGDTSGDRQFVREAYFDCDGDTLLFKVEQEGAGACHTGARTCFFSAFGDGS